MCHVLITGLKCIVLPCHSWFHYLIIMHIVCKMTEALSGVVKMVIGSRLPERRHNQQFLLELPQETTSFSGQPHGVTINHISHVHVCWYTFRSVRFYHVMALSVS